jgi:hypothetical protein
MDKSIIISEEVRATFTAHATLAGLGRIMQAKKVFEPIVKQVQISQKVVKYTPSEKLLDAAIGILAGAQGLVDLNKRVRPDIGLQRAFGRQGCAEQSVVQDTLDACSAENANQMHAAMDTIYRQQSQGYGHDYELEWQVLDIDMTGRPCGSKAAFASRGYFAKQRNRRGRQEGYVLATWYEEIVVKQVYDGKTQLTKALRGLITAAAATLNLDERKRKRTLLRIDAGGGTLAEVNWLLEHNYQLHCKDYSAVRARNLADSVKIWLCDPKDPNREIGRVTLPADDYVRPVTRIVVRCRKKNGQFGYGALISTLTPRDVLWLTGQSFCQQNDPAAVLLAYVYFYDARGGGVETEIKEDKQGLSITKRNKKRFAAQKVLTQLEVLAHNLLVWVRQWLAPKYPAIAQFGLQRFVRNILYMHGILLFDQFGRLLEIILNRADPYAVDLWPGLADLLVQEHVALTLGET